MKALRSSALVLALLAVLICCKGSDSTGQALAPEAFRGEEAGWRRAREKMVSVQIEGRGVTDGKVLAAMRKVPRHMFVPERLRRAAYSDRPLPIGHEQTISQPYIVAKMTELMKLDGDERVLEIGTGSGYQAAVLAEIVKEVYTIEIIPELGVSAGERLKKMGYDNVRVRIGDGYKGWPEAAPFDSIIVTAAPPYIPEPLVEQLKPGGRMVLPVGEGFQQLMVVTRTKEGFEKENIFPVRFVPMTGRVREHKKKE